MNLNRQTYGRAGKNKGAWNREDIKKEDKETKKERKTRKKPRNRAKDGENVTVFPYHLHLFLDIIAPFFLFFDI